jgi:hypothetical protein
MKRAPIALVPLASALAAISPIASAATPVDSQLQVEDAGATEPQDATRKANVFYNVGNDLMSMVAYQKADGTMTVEPDSHVSHASHSSHSSHSSHASSI